MQAAAPGIQSAGRCVCRVTPEQYWQTWPAIGRFKHTTPRHLSSQASAGRVESVSCKGDRCLTNPSRFWLHNHSRNKTDISINESSARPKQSTFEAKGEKNSRRCFFCFQLGRRTDVPPTHSAAIPKCTSVPGPYPPSSTFWCWILWFSSSLWYNLPRKAQACRKGLGGIQRGLLDRTYGNYSLIYHLGHGNSCKLGFH